MTLTEPDMIVLAERLDTAARTACGTTSIEAGRTLSVADAYRIQRQVLALRLQRGEFLVGVKLGFTSEAKMRQMGVSEVVVGVLTDRMQVQDGSELDLGKLIHPKAEPEIAMQLKRELRPGAGRPEIEAALAVAPAIEIIDSRYQNFKFTLADVIADNASAAAFAVGEWHEYLSIQNLEVILSTPAGRETGSTAAILGDPLRAVEALISICSRERIELPVGTIVLAGAATAAVPIWSGTTRCEIAGLGAVTIRGVR